VKGLNMAGRKVVANGKVTTVDHRGAAERLTETQFRMIATAPKRDYRRNRAPDAARHVEWCVW
jgi:hypothetical protein